MNDDLISTMDSPELDSDPIFRDQSVLEVFIRLLALALEREMDCQ